MRFWLFQPLENSETKVPGIEHNACNFADENSGQLDCTTMLSEINYSMGSLSTKKKAQRPSRIYINHPGELHS